MLPGALVQVRPGAFHHALSHAFRDVLPGALRRSLPGALLCALLAAAAVGSAPARAHGDLHEQIATMDRRIGAEPGRSDLVLRRAELRRLHREFDAAAADYARVLEMDPGQPEVHWLRARSRLEEGKPQLALPELDAFLQVRSGHASARLTRARAYAALGRPEEAAADFTEALRLLPQPEPDHYLERMRAEKAAGASTAARLAGLAQGLARLGSVPGLEDAALDIEIEARDWTAALARLDRRAAGSPRQEQWLYRRAQVLAQAGRTAEAAVALRNCLQAIESLPGTLGRNRAMGELAAAARADLERLQR